MDIGGAFLRKTGTFPGEAPLASRSVLPHSLAEFRQGDALPDARSGSLLGLENLPTLVHAGLEVEMVRTAQFARILVLGIGWLLQRVRRAAHATPRGRCFSSGNGHVESSRGGVGGIV